MIKELYSEHFVNISFLSAAPIAPISVILSESFKLKNDLFLAAEGLERERDSLREFYRLIENHFLIRVSPVSSDSVFANHLKRFKFMWTIGATCWSFANQARTN